MLYVSSPWNIDFSSTVLKALRWSIIRSLQVLRLTYINLYTIILRYTLMVYITDAKIENFVFSMSDWSCKCVCLFGMGADCTFTIREETFPVRAALWPFPEEYDSQLWQSSLLCEKRENSLKNSLKSRSRTGCVLRTCQCFSIILLSCFIKRGVD